MFLFSHASFVEVVLKVTTGFPYVFANNSLICSASFTHSVLLPSIIARLLIPPANDDGSFGWYFNLSI